MKFQRGDLVRTTWFDYLEKGALFQRRVVRGPAIVIEARSDIGWAKVWIPALNETLVTSSFRLEHYDPK